jgi:hypothetical protein
VRPPGVVLDTAALLAYARGDIRVGVLLAELASSGHTVVIPAACLATAYRDGDGDGDGDGASLLDLIGGLGHALVAPLRHEHCAVAGGWARVLGLDTAQAAVEAASIPFTPLMTDRGDLVRRFLPKDWPIIDV